MDFIEAAKKEIRTQWFENHVAEIIGEEGLQVIYWKQPGTSMYFAKFVLSGNNVFVSGDIGEAVYSLTCKATLENLKGFNLGYFTGKLSAFCEDRWDFDEKLAKKELLAHWKEYELFDEEDGREIYDSVVSAIEESSSVDAFHAWLMPIYQNSSITSDMIECIWDIGKRMPFRLIGYWVALQMIAEQLEIKESA